MDMRLTLVVDFVVVAPCCVPRGVPAACWAVVDMVPLAWSLRLGVARRGGSPLLSFLLRSCWGCLLWDASAHLAVPRVVALLGSTALLLIFRPSVLLFLSSPAPVMTPSPRPNVKRITARYMTKYERARVLGTRAQQISMGAPVMVELVGETDPLMIAHKVRAGALLWVVASPHHCGSISLCEWVCACRGWWSARGGARLVAVDSMLTLPVTGAVRALCPSSTSVCPWLACHASGSCATVVDVGWVGGVHRSCGTRRSPSPSGGTSQTAALRTGTAAS